MLRYAPATPLISSERCTKKRPIVTRKIQGIFREKPSSFALVSLPPAIAAYNCQSSIAVGHLRVWFVGAKHDRRARVLWQQRAWAGGTAEKRQDSYYDTTERKAMDVGHPIHPWGQSVP